MVVCLQLRPSEELENAGGIVTSGNVSVLKKERVDNSDEERGEAEENGDEDEEEDEAEGEEAEEAEGSISRAAAWRSRSLSCQQVGWVMLSLLGPSCSRLFDCWDN